eukprot:m.184445 g.184445  ORF g.184445 m.184445 type:complete len:514 (-) comp16669_c1_seq1:142-1683(-)
MMMGSRSLVLLAAALCCILACSHAARIAFFGFPRAPSHHMVFSKIGKELASRGHEVILIRTNLDGKHVNIDGLSTYEVQTDVKPEEMDSLTLELASLDPLAGFFKIFELVLRNCNAKVNDQKLRELLQNVDVVISDPNYMCSVVMSEASSARVKVHMSPTNFYDPYMSVPYGIPIPIATVPHMGTKLGPEMNFGERIHNSIVYFVNYLIRWYHIEPAANQIRASLGLTGSFYESFHNVSDIIYQTDFNFEFPRLVTPSTHMVGPILPEPAVPVKDERVQNILDTAEHGVVLVSFGTIARLEPRQAQILAESFGKLKQKVIWKYNGEKPQVADNTLLVDWIEQNNILGHPNVRAFVAHGGANGILEAAYHGVPLVGFALFADQWDNIMRAQYRGMGILVEKSSVTVEEMDRVLDAVLNDPSYATNAKEISAAIRDRLRTPTQEAADIIERALRRNGAFRHRMVAVDLPWFVNSGMDVALFWVIFFAVFIFAVILGFKRLCCRSKAKASSKQKAQ